MNKAEKKIEAAFEAGKAFLLATRREKAIGRVASQPLPRKRYGKRVNGVKRIIRGGLGSYSKAEKFELLHLSADINAKAARTRFEDALSKLNKEEAGVLAQRLEAVKV